jgi:hypothetical protein
MRAKSKSGHKFEVYLLIGFLYRGDRKPFQPAVGATNIDLSELEWDFEL